MIIYLDWNAYITHGSENRKKDGLNNDILHTPDPGD
jgi:hypothetical protein